MHEIKLQSRFRIACPLLLFLKYNVFLLYTVNKLTVCMEYLDDLPVGILKVLLK